MQTGSVLTLNFYSNPINVMIGDDQIIYINKDHFLGMFIEMGEIPPHNVIRGEFDVDYVPFTYIVNHLPRLVGKTPPIDAWLVLNEFPNYIIRELGVVRDILPIIELDHAVYESGIFEHGGKMFVLKNKLHKFTGIHEPVLPADVPRFPILVSVKTVHVTQPFRSLLAEKAKVTLNILPTWMIEVSSLPYIVQSSSAPTVMLNSGRDDLGPRQRFDSPGIVGTHRCELDPEQKERDDNVRKALFQDLDEPMTWAGSGLTLKSEL